METILKSQHDHSVNFVNEGKTGITETRYVRREPDYFIGYLSSQTGCNRGCRFCHLTTTGQTSYKNIGLLEFQNQARTIVDYYRREPKASIVNWNFMARGEPLANPQITEMSAITFTKIAEECYDLDFDLIQRFNISTIMPVTIKKPLSKMFPVITPTIYYSIYSVNQEWRDRWMPAAMNVDKALDNLKDYQEITGKKIVFHSAFIKGENDSRDDIFKMMEKIAYRELDASFNIVRYNPYSNEYGRETDMTKLIRIENLISKDYMPARIVTRVGTDIHASCGQFVNNKM